MTAQAPKRRLTGLAIAVLLAIPATGEPLSPIRVGDYDLLAAHAKKTLDALSEIDATHAAKLHEDLRSAVDAEEIPSRKANALQRVLDGACLLAVAINPESRVKVSAGPAGRELRSGAWRTYLVKVHNLAAVKSPLRVLSEQESGDSRGGWLEIELHNGEALRQELTGDLAEYRVLRVRTSQVGFRAAIIAMDVGQGTADIGFRNDILVTFRCEEPE